MPISLSLSQLSTQCCLRIHWASKISYKRIRVWINDGHPPNFNCKLQEEIKSSVPFLPPPPPPQVTQIDWFECEGINSMHWRFYSIMNLFFSGCGWLICRFQRHNNPQQQQRRWQADTARRRRWTMETQGHGMWRHDKRMDPFRFNHKRSSCWWRLFYDSVDPSIY